MMFETDLKYCPECKEEYRPEISVCPLCVVDLLSGTQMLQKHGNPDQKSQAKVEIQAGDELVAMQKGNLLDMKRVKNLFAKHNIPALLIKDEQCRSGCCGGVEVVLQIRWGDRDRAAVILQEEHERTTGITFDQDHTKESIFNPDAQLAVCPACGHSFSPNGPDCPDCGLCFI
jgi:hypothetical protein